MLIKNITNPKSISLLFFFPPSKKIYDCFKKLFFTFQNPQNRSSCKIASAFSSSHGLAIRAIAIEVVETAHPSRQKCDDKQRHRRQRCAPPRAAPSKGKASANTISNSISSKKLTISTFSKPNATSSILEVL